MRLIIAVENALHQASFLRTFNTKHCEQERAFEVTTS